MTEEGDNSQPEDAFKDIVKKTKPESKLVFDFKSHELEVKNQDSPTSESEVVVDQIYKDGFFVSEPI